MQGLGLAADDQKDAHGVYPAQHDEVAGAQHWQEGGEEVRWSYLVKRCFPSLRGPDRGHRVPLPKRGGWDPQEQSAYSK
jgi:hypothetical protein